MTMGKISVLGTASRAYGFLLGEFGTIFRLAWAPLLIGVALSFFYGAQAIDATIAAGPNPDQARAMANAPVQFLIGCVSFATSVMVSVALLRVVIFGDRKPGLFVYLWLGGAELRLIAVTLLLFIAAIAGGIAAALVFGALVAASAVIPLMGVVTVIALFAFLLVLIWGALRLSLIWPVVVAENNLGVERSWAITRGHVLALLGVLIVVFIPYLVVSLTIYFVVMGGDMPGFPAFPDWTLKDAAAAKTAAETFEQGMEHWNIDLLKATRKHWAELHVLEFIGGLISAALSAGALGSAYTAIVGERRE